MLYCYSIRILLYVIVYFYHSLFIHVLIWYNMIFNMVHFSSFLLLLLMLISIMELHIMWCCVSPTRFLKENKLACILRSAFPSIVSPPSRPSIGLSLPSFPPTTSFTLPFHLPTVSAGRLRFIFPSIIYVLCPPLLGSSPSPLFIFPPSNQASFEMTYIQVVMVLQLLLIYSRKGSTMIGIRG